MVIKLCLFVGKAAFPTNDGAAPCYIMAENDNLQIAVENPPENLYATLDCEGKKQVDLLAENGIISVSREILSPGKLKISLYRFAGGVAVESWTADTLTVARLPGEYKATPEDVERDEKIADLLARVATLEEKVDGVKLEIPNI